MLVTHKNNDLISVITSQGILVWSAEPSYARSAILGAGFTEGQADFALSDSGLSDAATFRATLANCFANTLERLDGEVEALAVSSDQEREELKGQLEKIKTQVTAVSRQTEIEALRQAIRDRETEVRAELIRQFGSQYNEFWVSWSTKAERAKLAEMEASRD